MVKIFFFGRLAEATKGSETQIEFKGSLNDLLNKLYLNYPVLKGQTFSVAVNREIISEISQHEIKENDTVALLPPFAGG